MPAPVATRGGRYEAPAGAKGVLATSISMNAIGEGATPLMYACQQSRDLEVKSILLKKPHAVRERDRTSKTALHYCAENTCVTCAEMILKAAPDLVDARDEDGYTALHLAVIAGNRGLIKTLITKKTDVNSLDNERHSVVHWATVCGEVEALELVLDAGARASTPDIHGGYPIHYAAQMCGPNSEMGNDVRFGLAVLRKLLGRGVAVNVTDRDGRQPILWAASAGSADAILALVNAGASVEADDKDGLTALHCAASRGHTDCLETLITLCGAEIDVIDSNGCTALFYSVTLGHADSTQLLLSFGAEPNRQDRKGRTPGHCGAAKGQLETLRILGAHDANLWMRNVKGDFPLHDAVASGRKDLVRWLLTQRPDAVNAPNNDGRCALHIAAINNNVEMCKIVLDSGSLLNPVLRTSKGQLMTPLDAALHRGNRGCAKYIQLHGGVPVSKLTETNAQIKGGVTRVAPPETPTENLATPDPGVATYSLVPGGVTPVLSVSPIGDAVILAEDPSQRGKRGESRYLQVRLNDDVAIRHVERLDDAVVYRRHRFVDDDSSEDEMRRRRRRRRRRERRSGSRGDDSDDVDDEKRRRRRRRRDEEDSYSEDERSTSVRRRRRKERGSDSDRDTRRKWTGSRQESEESEEVSDVEKKAKTRVSGGQQGKVTNDRRSVKTKASDPPSKSIKSRAKSKESKRVEVEEDAQENVSEESVDAKANRDSRRETKSTERERKKSTTRAGMSSKTKPEKITDKSRKLDVEKEDKKIISSRENRDSKKRQPSNSKTRESERKVSSTSEEKPKVRKTNKPTTEEHPKTTPRKSVQKPAKRSTEKVSKSVVRESPRKKSFEVVDEVVDEVVGDVVAQVEEEVQQKVADVLTESPLLAATAEKSRQVVTAIVHNEQGSIIEINKEVGESGTETTQSNQDGGDAEESDVSVLRNQSTSGKDSESVGRDSNTVAVEESSEDKAESRNDEETSEQTENTGAERETDDNDAERESQENEKESDGNPFLESVETVVEVGGSQADVGSVEEREKMGIDGEEDEPKAVEVGGNEEDEEEGVSKYQDDFEEVVDVDEEGKKQEEGGEERAKCEGGDADEEDVEKESVEVSEELLEGEERKSRRRQKRESHGSETVTVSPVGNEHDDLDNFLESERNDSRRNGDNVRRSASASNVREERDGVVDGEESRSRSEASTTRNGDSSLLLDSGFEPSPRREAAEQEAKTAEATTPGRRPRVSRPCRTDGEERPAISTVSVTRAVQNSIRKYHLERSIFQELLELKRLQIRSGRANEQVLVKRLVDEYRKAGLIVGRRQYEGIYTYRNFEKYLYDQLRLLQTSERTLIPRIKSTDDLEKLTRALRDARLTPLYDAAPENPIYCTHGTHRCHHAAHAYTGVPCAAYITKLNHHQMPKNGQPASSRGGFLPRIDSKPGVRRPSRYVDPSRPVTLELSHGAEKQVIKLPTNALDKTKRYYVTFTIKGGPTAEKKEESEAVGEVKGDVANSDNQESLGHQHAKSL